MVSPPQSTDRLSSCRKRHLAYWCSILSEVLDFLPHVGEVAAFLDFSIEIIKRSDTAQGFEVLPRCWVVERTFGWMTRWRRLVRDYEERIDCSQAMIHVALGSILLRRIAHQ